MPSKRVGRNELIDSPSLRRWSLLSGWKHVQESAKIKPSIINSIHSALPGEGFLVNCFPGLTKEYFVSD